MGALRRDPGLSPDEEHGRFVTKIRNAGAVGFTVAFLLDSFELRLGVSKTDPQASCRAFSSRNKGKEMTVIPLDLDQIRSEILPNGTRRWTSLTLSAGILHGRQTPALIPSPSGAVPFEHGKWSPA